MADRLVISIDAATPEGAATLVQTAIDRHGHLDGAFNNAGGVLAGGPLTELTDTAWQNELALNLTSVF